MLTEPLVPDVDMCDTVQEWQNVPGRCDRRAAIIEIVRLAGQNDRVIDRCHFRREHGLHSQLRVPERALDLQPLLGEDLAPPLPDKKLDISSTLDQATTEIAANSPDTEHQDRGIIHNRSSSSPPIAA